MIGVFGDREGAAKAIVPTPLRRDTIVLASHEKTGTVLSGQLVHALKPYVNAKHDFYWSPVGNSAHNAIEFVRNPFSMIMSAYYYHMSCVEALFNTPPLQNVGYSPHMRLLIGTNVSFCERLRTLPRNAGLRLQYDFSIKYPYPQLYRSVRAEPPLLRVCLGDWVKNPRRELSRVGRVLGLTDDELENVYGAMETRKRREHKTNAVHFTKYDEFYDADIEYLRKYDNFRGRTFRKLEKTLGCGV